MASTPDNQYLFFPDVNSSRVGECGKLEFLVAVMCFYRQLYLEVFERHLTGAGIVTRASLFVGGNLAQLFWKLSGEGGLRHVGEKPVRVLVINPLFQTLVAGRFVKQVDLSCDGKGLVLVVDRQNQDRLLILEHIEDQCVPESKHRMADFQFLGFLPVESPVGIQRGGNEGES